MYILTDSVSIINGGGGYWRMVFVSIYITTNYYLKFCPTYSQVFKAF